MAVDTSGASFVALGEVRPEQRAVVLCRIKRSASDSAPDAVLRLGDSFVLVKNGKYPRIPETVRAHKVFGAEEPNDAVASTVWNSVMDAVHSRENIVVTALGATGSGKTHTMVGGQNFQDMGIIGSTVCGLSGLCSADAVALGPGSYDGDRSSMFGDQRLACEMSVVEVVGNSMHDLLGATMNSRAGAALVARDALGVKKVLSSQKVATVKLPEEVGTTLQLLQLSMANRREYTKDKAKANGRYSRTHLVVMVDLKPVGDSASLPSSKTTTSPPWCRVVLCDLAGTDTVGKRAATGALSTEGRQINLDIHYLTEALVSASSATWASKAGVGPRSSPGSRGRRNSLDSEGVLSLNDSASMRLSPGAEHDGFFEEKSEEGDPSGWKREVVGSDVKVVPGFRNCNLTKLLRLVYHDRTSSRSDTKPTRTIVLATVSASPGDISKTTGTLSTVRRFYHEMSGLPEVLVGPSMTSEEIHLRKKMAVLNHTIEDQRHEIRVLRAEILRLHELLDAEAAKERSAPAAPAQPTETMQHLSQALQESEALKEEALNDLGRAREEVAALEDQLDRVAPLQDQMQNLRAENDTLRSRVKELQRKLEQAPIPPSPSNADDASAENAEIARLKRQLLQVSSDNDRLHQELQEEQRAHRRALQTSPRKGVDSQAAATTPASSVPVSSLLPRDPTKPIWQHVKDMEEALASQTADLNNTKRRRLALFALACWRSRLRDGYRTWTMAAHAQQRQDLKAQAAAQQQQAGMRLLESAVVRLWRARTVVAFGVWKNSTHAAATAAQRQAHALRLLESVANSWLRRCSYGAFTLWQRAASAAMRHDEAAQHAAALRRRSMKTLRNMLVRWQALAAAKAFSFWRDHAAHAKQADFEAAQQAALQAKALGRLGRQLRRAYSNSTQQRFNAWKTAALQLRMEEERAAARRAAQAKAAQRVRTALLALLHNRTWSAFHTWRSGMEQADMSAEARARCLRRLEAMASRWLLSSYQGAFELWRRHAVQASKRLLAQKAAAQQLGSIVRNWTIASKAGAFEVWHRHTLAAAREAAAAKKEKQAAMLRMQHVLQSWLKNSLHHGFRAFHMHAIRARAHARLQASSLSSLNLMLRRWMHSSSRSALDLWHHNVKAVAAVEQRQRRGAAVLKHFLFHRAGAAVRTAYQRWLRRVTALRAAQAQRRAALHAMKGHLTALTRAFSALQRRTVAGRFEQWRRATVLAGQRARRAALAKAMALKRLAFVTSAHARVPHSAAFALWRRHTQLRRTHTHTAAAAQQLRASALRSLEVLLLQWLRRSKAGSMEAWKRCTTAARGEEALKRSMLARLERYALTWQASSVRGSFGIWRRFAAQARSAAEKKALSVALLDRVARQWARRSVRGCLEVWRRSTLQGRAREALRATQRAAALSLLNDQLRLLLRKRLSGSFALWQRAVARKKLTASKAQGLRALRASVLARLDALMASKSKIKQASAMAAWKRFVILNVAYEQREEVTARLRRSSLVWMLRLLQSMTQLSLRSTLTIWKRFAVERRLAEERDNMLSRLGQGLGTLANLASSLRSETLGGGKGKGPLNEQRTLLY